MGIETTYSAVVGGLVRFVLALNANAAPKLFRERYGNRSEKLAGLGLQPFSDWKLRSSKSSTPSEPTAPVPTPAPTAAHPAANANPKP
ncbi:MAG TPA: hypothetical protein VLX28_23590 [Thermoanaerobaculia bacterium]|nr:hypothetical protein [Thermoanaerobaculia bacterium]